MTNNVNGRSIPREFLDTTETTEEQEVKPEEKKTTAGVAPPIDKKVAESKTWQRIQARKAKKAATRDFNPMKVASASAEVADEDDEKLIDQTFSINQLNVRLQMLYDDMTRKKVGKLSVQEERVCESIKVADILIGQFNKYRDDVADDKTISLDQYNDEVERFKELFARATENDPDTYNPFPEGVNLEKVDEETLIGFINDLTKYVESKQFDLTKISRDLKTAIEFHLQISMITAARVGKETDVDRMIRAQTATGG